MTVTTTAAATTPQARVSALVAAIRNLQPGDIRAAYRLGDVKEGASRRYLVRFDRASDPPLFDEKPGKQIEYIWCRVLNDIAEREGRMNR